MISPQGQVLSALHSVAHHNRSVATCLEQNVLGTMHGDNKPIKNIACISIRPFIRRARWDDTCIICVMYLLMIIDIVSLNRLSIFFYSFEAGIADAISSFK